MEFYKEKHINYIKKISNDKESFEFTASQHFRMSGVYWGMTALSLLQEKPDNLFINEIIEWVMSCQHNNGG